MKAYAITKSFTLDQTGNQIVTENSSICNFDQTEVFSWTVIRDENNIPDYITLITKNGISLELEYDENVLSSLASEFRQRNVL